MKQQYLFQPDAVEVYRVGKKSDIILRKDITEVEKTEENTQEASESSTYTVYECDEVQFRYDGIVTRSAVEDDFDTWWDYPSSDADNETVTESSIERQITDLQVALCEVYELLTAE